MGKLLAVTLASAAALAAQNARSAVEAALQAMGNPKSIQYTGSGATFNVGQNVNPTTPWPRAELRSLTRTIDYETQSLRHEPAGPQGPGAAQFASGDRAWNRAPNGNITPAPQAVAERQMQIRVSPHGFLRAAAASRNARARSRGAGGRRVTEISFSDGPRRYIGVLSENLVERVDTWIDNPVLGDMAVETSYADYKDFGGVKLPTKIAQKHGGFPSLELTISEARAGVAADVAVPDAVRQFTPSVTVASEKLAEGVWYLTGGSHHSLLVEFADHVAVVEAPLSEERSLAVIAEVKKTVPAKPIRYLVNTHHHFDHSGGLRAYVAEGATIVTHQVNAPFYQNTLSARRTINPDRLTRERRKPKIAGFTTKHTLADARRTLELHHIEGNPHHDGILLAWLPAERILSEVDVYSPAPPDTKPPPPSPAALNLFENIQRLGLDVDRIAALHGRTVTFAEFRKAVGK
jgi:glyoxylase-like metal-dependent hydrolase (beta-lactamase superfamily II)